MTQGSDCQCPLRVRWLSNFLGAGSLCSFDMLRQWSAMMRPTGFAGESATAVLVEYPDTRRPRATMAAGCRRQKVGGASKRDGQFAQHQHQRKACLSGDSMALWPSYGGHVDKLGTQD